MDDIGKYILRLLKKYGFKRTSNIRTIDYQGSIKYEEYLNRQEHLDRKIIHSLITKSSSDASKDDLVQIYIANFKDGSINYVLVYEPLELNQGEQIIKVI